jgi:hypothetical protein
MAMLNRAGALPAHRRRRYLAKPFAIAELIERVKRRADEHFGPTTSRWWVPAGYGWTCSAANCVSATR